MLTAIILFLVSLACIYIEFFVPGGIFAVLGGMVYIASLSLFISDPSINGIYKLFFAVGSIIAIGLLIKFALGQIQRKKSDNDFYLHTDQEGYKAATYSKELIGKEGIATCDLRPGGYALIDNQKIAVIAQTGYIEKDTKIIVIEGSGTDVIVRPFVQ